MSFFFFFEKECLNKKIAHKAKRLHISADAQKMIE